MRKIYWKNGFEEIDIHSKAFVNELEEEKRYFSDRGFEKIVKEFNDLEEFIYNVENIDNYFVDNEKININYIRNKNIKEKYAKRDKLVHNNFNKKKYYETLDKSMNNKEYRDVLNIIGKQTSSLSMWNDTMSLIYSSAESICMLKELIDRDLIKPSSRIVDRLLGEKDVFLNDEEQYLFFQFLIPKYDYLNFEKDEVFASYARKEFDNQISKIKQVQHNQARTTRKIAELAVSSEETNKKLIMDAENRIEELETSYQEKLKFDAPAKYWKEKSNEYVVFSRKWLAATITTGILLLISIIVIACSLFNVSLEAGELNILFTGIDKTITINSIVIFALLESVVIYMLRTCLKYYDYYIKLSEFYKSKSMLSSFYVTIKSDDDIDDEIKRNIYKELFSIRDINGDPVPAMEMIGITSQK
ncbi:MAG: DUF6161 domain-containing protein [Coprobacillaceae bacterium]